MQKATGSLARHRSELTERRAHLPYTGSARLVDSASAVAARRGQGKFASAARALILCGLAVSTTMTTSGCGLVDELHEITLEVAGEGPPAVEVTYTSYLNAARSGTQRNVLLPWRKTQESEFAAMHVKATPAPGAKISCRIVVDGEPVAAVTSPAPGMPVECRKDQLD